MLTYSVYKYYKFRMSQQNLSQYFGQKTKSGNRKKEVGLSNCGGFHYKTSNNDNLQVNRANKSQQIPAWKFIYDLFSYSKILAI